MFKNLARGSTFNCSVRRRPCTTRDSSAFSPPPINGDTTAEGSMPQLPQFELALRPRLRYCSFLGRVRDPTNTSEHPGRQAIFVTSRGPNTELDSTPSPWSARPLARPSLERTPAPQSRSRDGAVSIRNKNRASRS
ncbi:hypothetical protein C8Q80DRAFT_1143930 [Daedaleopsis nitida]|nr:hypothetical protein C8Q80DRAFT_1143930 [Daedaleopsis nitida]